MTWSVSYAPQHSSTNQIRLVMYIENISWSSAKCSDQLENLDTCLSDWHVKAKLDTSEVHSFFFCYCH